MNPRAAFITLGCRLNQLESEAIVDAFSKNGFTIVNQNESADIYIINTCTVTSMAEQKARRLIRKALKDAPLSCVVVTGCYAEVGEKELSLLGDRVFVVKGSKKDILLDLAKDIYEHFDLHTDIATIIEDFFQKDKIDAGSLSHFRYHPESFTYHSRASLKIQDGCDNLCAYCRVRLARGKAVSLPLNLAIERAMELEKAGFREIVLSGINLAQYKSDTVDFSGLLTKLLENTSEMRFRISSWEPEKTTDDFLRAASHFRVQNYFHLAVQSLSDSVLERMNRPYLSDAVVRAVHDLRSVKDNPFFGADVIGGFPGETEAEAKTSLNLFDELDFTWLHVFPFSARPDTAAFTMKPKVQDALIQERCASLHKLAQKKRYLFAEAHVGKELSAIVEEDGTVLSSEYLHLKIENFESLQNIHRNLVTVRMTSVNGKISESRLIDDDIAGKCLVF